MKKILILFSFLLFLLVGTTSVFAASTSYTVVKGDTLYSISRKFNVSVSDLQTWNHLINNTIYVNEALVVSGGSSTTTQNTTTTSQITYTVASGDTLYSISRKFNVSFSDLKIWNNLVTNTIYVNQKLLVLSVSKNFSGQATAYTADCAGCSGITATGINLKANPTLKVISVDPNTIKLGSNVFVQGYGLAVAGDKGSGITGTNIDVFIPSEKDALAWGRKTVEIYVLN